jgi:phage/plasmid-associated DNA primase
VAAGDIRKSTAQYIPHLNATVNDLDTNPWLLNVENGTVDLQTGELLLHRKEDMITKLAKVRCDREKQAAPCGNSLSGRSWTTRLI